MKSRITIHPVKTSLLDDLNINSTSLVANPRVGAIINRLVSKGYTEIKVDVDHDKGEIKYHCCMDKKRAKKYI